MGRSARLARRVLLSVPAKWLMLSIALLLALFFGHWMADLARPSSEPVVPPKIEGDDNRDGTIDEDESGWN